MVLALSLVFLSLALPIGLDAPPRSLSSPNLAQTLSGQDEETAKPDWESNCLHWWFSDPEKYRKYCL